MLKIEGHFFFHEKKKGFFKWKKRVLIFQFHEFFLEGEGFGFLPVEVGVFTSKMSIGGCFLENGFLQIQVPREREKKLCKQAADIKQFFGKYITVGQKIKTSLG